MKLSMKTGIRSIIAVMMLVVMTGCGVIPNIGFGTEPDAMTAAETVAADTISLDIVYGGNDSANSVTQNVGLLTSGTNGSTITWASDMPTTIAIDGSVTRPLYGNGNAAVILTATIANNGISDTKVFNLTVIERPQTDSETVAADKAILAITYAGTDSAGSVTQNVGLSTTGSSGTTITWSSSNTTVIAINGTVTRPVFGNGNASVTLTATITKNAAIDTKVFNLTVIEGQQTDSASVVVDKFLLSIIYYGTDSAGSVTLAVGLSTTGSNGTTITWSSSNTSIIAVNGTVMRPAFGNGNANITLTATITKNAAIDTKVFNLTVIETPPTDTEAVAVDFAALQIIYSGTDSAGSVTQNVGLSTTGSSGTTITWDSSNLAFISINGTVTRPVFGSGNAAVTLTATITKNATIDTKVFNLTVIERPQTDSEAVAADKAILAITYGGTDSAGSVTQNVGLSTTGSSGTTITWFSSYTSIIAVNGTVTRPAFGNGNANVTLTATISKNATSDTKVFNLTVIETPPTDAEVVAVDLAALQIIYGGSDSAGSVTQNVGLSTTGSSGTNITWSSSNTAVIAANGTVTRPLFGNGNAAVTLAATITKNATSDTKVFNLTVIETPPTDAEVVAVDLAALQITYSGSDSLGSVTLSLGLSSTGSSGTTITWSSSNTAVIAINGTVTRPVFGSGNTAVTLTATITKNATSNTKVFNLTVIEAPLVGTKYANTVDIVTFNMVYIPGKTTFTGLTNGTQATVANNYLLAETEVTYALWIAVATWASSNGYTFANWGSIGDGVGDTDQDPVTNISWRDAMIWTNALTEYYNIQNGTSYACVYTSDVSYTTCIRSCNNGMGVTGTTPGSQDAPYVNPNAKGFRLPMLAEWELAARYISDTNGDGDIMDAGEYYSGNYASGATAPYTNAAATGSVAWYTGNSSSSTHPVAQKTANALGLYDMNGNVSELNSEWYSTSTTFRALRGGSWFDSEIGNTTGYIGTAYPYTKYSFIGFRVARTP